MEIVLVILVIFLLIFIIQNKVLTGNSIRETDKINLINDCGKETIIYNFGNLCWQKFQMPETAENWQDADSYCKNLTLADYTNRKIPTPEKLRAIKDYMKTESNLFRDTLFWTSTP